MTPSDAPARLDADILRLARALPHLDRAEIVLEDGAWRWFFEPPDGSAHDRIETLALAEGSAAVLGRVFADPRLPIAMSVPLRAARRHGEVDFEIKGAAGTLFEARLKGSEKLLARLGTLARLMTRAPLPQGHLKPGPGLFAWKGLCPYDAATRASLTHGAFSPVGTVHRIHAPDAATAVRCMRFDAVATAILRFGAVPDAGGIVPREVVMELPDGDVPALLDDLDLTGLSESARSEEDAR